MGYEVSMDSCPNCGRQRSGSDRFCRECGAEYPERTSDVTRVDVPAEVTRFDTPAAPKPETPADDPFASWFAPQAPAAQDNPAAPPAPAAPSGWQAPGGSSGQWQPTETLRAGSTRQGGGYQPPAQPGPAFPQGPAFPPSQTGKPRGGRRAAFFIAGLLVVLAAGGGAYALVSSAGQHSSGQPSASGTRRASTVPASTAPASPATGGTTSTSPATPASPTAASGGVTLGPGVAANPAAPKVQTLLGHYFPGINTHDYTEYASVLDAGMRASQPESQFNSGYGSTRDSGMTLTSLAPASNGTLAATVTFTSHQDPAQSVDHSSCNHWTLTLYLVRQGSGYLITHAPTGYQPVYSDC